MDTEPPPSVECLTVTESGYELLSDNARELFHK